MEFRIGTERIGINMPDWPQLDAELRRRMRAGVGFALATLNLDHIVKMRADPGFAAIYADHDLIVADGRPIVWLSHLARRPITLLPGSDLVRPMARLAAEEGMRVALVGSTEPALADAARDLRVEAPGIEIVLQIAPDYGFDPQGAEAEAILRQLADQRVGICFLAFGAPKQEQLAVRGRGVAPDVGFVSVGAGLDFLGGHQRRAPAAFRALALEWLWRLARDPRRMLPRYLRCLAILPGQVMAAWRLRRAG